MSNTDEVLHANVLSYVNDIEAAVAGNLYKIEGDYKIIEDIDDWISKQYEKKVSDFSEKHPESEGFDHDQYDSYQEFMEDCIGTKEDIEEPESQSLYYYLSDTGLGDVRVEIDVDTQEVTGGRMLLCYGGPNVWLHDDEVRGYWGCENVSMSLNSDARSALFSWFEERWEACRNV